MRRGSRSPASCRARAVATAIEPLMRALSRWARTSSRYSGCGVSLQPDARLLGVRLPVRVDEFPYDPPLVAAHGYGFSGS